MHAAAACRGPYRERNAALWALLVQVSKSHYFFCGSGSVFYFLFLFFSQTFLNKTSVSCIKGTLRHPSIFKSSIPALGARKRQKMMRIALVLACVSYAVAASPL
jgi:hypothetical protein